MVGGHFQCVDDVGLFLGGLLDVVDGVVAAVEAKVGLGFGGWCCACALEPLRVDGGGRGWEGCRRRCGHGYVEADRVSTAALVERVRWL